MNRKVLTSIIILVIIVGVFAYLNAGDVEDRALSQKEAILFLNYQTVLVYNLLYNNSDKKERG